MALPGSCGQGGRGPTHCRTRGVRRILGRAARRTGSVPRHGRPPLSSLPFSYTSSQRSLEAVVGQPGSCLPLLPPPLPGRDGTGRWVRLCQAPADTGRDGGARSRGGERGPGLGWIRAQGACAGRLSERGGRGPVGWAGPGAAGPEAFGSAGAEQGRSDPSRPEASGCGEAAPGPAGPEVSGPGGQVCQTPAVPVRAEVSGRAGVGTVRSRSTPVGPEVRDRVRPGGRSAPAPSLSARRADSCSGYPIVELCWSLRLSLRPAIPRGM